MTENKKKFADFDLLPGLIQAVEDLGFTHPTPIQEVAIPLLLEGRDAIGRARTGSGKTAAFGLPLLNRVHDGKNVRALVLAPTRELANQVATAMKSFAKKLKVTILPIYGGTSYDSQLRGLKRGAGIVVGTPGRVIDLMERGALDLSGVEYFVLDEADEMLRMGFIEDVEKILARLPDERQIALFSATMPTRIERVAKKYLRKPAQIQVEESALTTEHIEQSFIRVNQRDKGKALLRLLAGIRSEGTLVFARTRVGCAETAHMLIKNGVSAEALHGDLNQSARERVLARLRNKSLDVVVATDVAARGLDVEHLTHVINMDMPESAETYTHRIGRTGRAGRAGTAISFVLPRERRKAKDFERELRAKIRDARLPSDKDIADFRRDELLGLLEAELSDSKIEGVREWLLEVVIEKGWATEDLAAAAIRLLGKQMNFELDAAPEQSSEPVFKGSINECEIVLSLGRRDGIRPSDIVGVFANELDVPSRQIGRISLGSARSFVGLPKSVAQHLVDLHPQVNIRGTMANIQLNQSSGGGGGGGSSRPSRDSKARPKRVSNPPRESKPRESKARESDSSEERPKRGAKPAPLRHARPLRRGRSETKPERSESPREREAPKAKEIENPRVETPFAEKPREETPRAEKPREEPPRAEKPREVKPREEKARSTRSKPRPERKAPRSEMKPPTPPSSDKPRTEAKPAPKTEQKEDQKQGDESKTDGGYRAARRPGGYGKAKPTKKAKAKAKTRTPKKKPSKKKGSTRKTRAAANKK